MLPDSPPSRSNLTSPAPLTQRRPRSYAEAAQLSASNKRNTNRRPLCNASIVLYSNQQYGHLLTSDPALLAIPRSQNPNSVVFNCQQPCSEAELEDILVHQIGPVVALSSRAS
ncbi:hypothetical protein BJV82DRAFT_670946 [Fennellomyces sp. T-0311]|nr:hypothetical protein BJV82DRAFT_670946 [Fennellomyces sp. T-0311]